MRIVDYPVKTKLKSLKANLIDQYFATKGTVVRVGNIRPMVTRMSFQCARCGESTVRHFEGGSGSRGKGHRDRKSPQRRIGSARSLWLGSVGLVGQVRSARLCTAWFYFGSLGFALA